MRNEWNCRWNWILVHESSYYKHKTQFLILRIHSISIKKSSLPTPFSTLSISYFSRMSWRRGQTMQMCRTVWTPMLHAHTRSSRLELGKRLSLSIRRLCDPVRYLVTCTRWNSNFWLYSGDTRSWLIIKYVPSLESESSLAAFSNLSLTKFR